MTTAERGSMKCRLSPRSSSTLETQYRKNHFDNANSLLGTIYFGVRCVLIATVYVLTRIQPALCNMNLLWFCEICWACSVEWYDSRDFHTAFASCICICNACHIESVWRARNMIDYSWNAFTRAVEDGMLAQHAVDELQAYLIFQVAKRVICFKRIYQDSSTPRIKESTHITCIKKEKRVSFNGPKKNSEQDSSSIILPLRH